MLSSLIIGLFAGYILSIPPIGPTSFAVISKGFKKDIVAGTSIGAGAGFMDMFYILIAYGGVSAIISFIPEHINNFFELNELYFKAGLTLLGCFIVIFYGFKIMKMKIEQDNNKNDKIGKMIEKGEKYLEKKEEEVEKILYKKHVVPVQNENIFSCITINFFSGAFLCLSSITLPASWIAFVGYLKSYGVIDKSFISGLMLAIGVFAGTTLWFNSLTYFLSKKSESIRPSTLNKLNIAVGIILILLGVFLFLKAIQFTYFILSP